MGGKKLLLQTLLTLLIGTQAGGGAVTSIEQMNELIGTVEMIDDSYLYVDSYTIDNVPADYLTEVYAQAETQANYYLTNNSTANSVVEVIETETGWEYAPLQEETVGGITYTKGGMLGAVTNVAFLTAIASNLGLDMWGDWQYEHSSEFKNDYQSLMGNELDKFYDLADKVREEGGTLEDWRSLIGASKIEGVNNVRIPFTDSDWDKIFNGDRNLDNIDDYLKPTKAPKSTIRRVMLDESRQFWADKISQFFNKNEVQDAVRKFYEIGVYERFITSYADYDVGGYHAVVNTQPRVEHVRNIINLFLDGKHDTDIIPPSNFFNSWLSGIGVENYNFVYTSVFGDRLGDDTTNSTTKVTVYSGNINQYEQLEIISAPPTGLAEDEHDNEKCVFVDNLTAHIIVFYSTGAYTTQTLRNVSINLPLRSHTYSRHWSAGSNRHSFYAVGGNAFIEQFEEEGLSALFDWATSNLRFPSVDEALAYFDTLPKFTVRTVGKDGNAREDDYIKLPFLKKLKNAENEKYTDDDFVEDVDLNEAEDEDIPDFLDKDMIDRKPSENKEDYQKDYGIEDPEVIKTTKTTPSPSDVKTPPKGVDNPATKPTTNTSGGSPVIVPPIVPIGGSASALFSVYNPTASQIDALGSYLWSSNIIELLAKFLQNPIDAVISLHQIYVTPSTSGSKNIKLGYLDSGVSASCVSEQYETLDCGFVYLPEYYGDARDFTPWTQVQIYLPFIGIVPLSPEDIIGSRVNVKYGIDVYTGALLCTITVYKPDGSVQILYQYEGNNAVQYPLTSGNMTGFIKGGLGMLTGGVVGGVSGAVVGGLTGAMSGGASVSRSGGFGSNSGAMGYKKPYIIINRKIPDDAFSYQSFYGFPSNRNVTLGACSGFTRVKDINLNNISATEEEKTEIDFLLKSGVLV